ncbi:restriction endonuclease subunit S [Heyndrickxia coagulans]|nr:restriction endonuclease subunit S [Heyndrickxia coagulans]MED4406905.1 restriction endonuclease subunit S [Heyndrickxia coagulans]
MEEALVPEEEQPYEVPGNWIWVYSKFLLDFIGGGTPPKGYNKYWDGDIPWATVKDIKGRYLVTTRDKITVAGLENSSTTMAYENELLLITRMSPGKSTITKISTAINQDLKIVRPKIQIQPYFLWLFFTVNRTLIESMSTGTTVKGIQVEKLKKIPFPVPPLKEQIRIAAKVERLLSKIDEAKRLIEEAKETFELRRAAIIKIILDEGINNNSIPMGWRKIKIKDLFTIFGGGTPSKSNKGYWNGKIPWISAKDMKSTYISETQDHITELGLKNSSTKLANKGSIAMVVRSGILQRTLPVAFLQKECSVNQDIKVFDSGNELVNKYFMWYVKGNEKNLLNNYSKSGTTVNSIEFEKFRFHEFILPPLEIVKRKVEKIENTIGKEESINQFLHIDDSLELLKQSILSKAFRGELGTNDPDEESAIELLKEVLQEQTN